MKKAKFDSHCTHFWLEFFDELSIFGILALELHSIGGAVIGQTCKSYLDLVKFVFSKKATKIKEIFTVYLTLTKVNTT